VYDPNGTLLWTHQFGTSSADLGTGISVDEWCNVYISGETEGSLGGPYMGGDAFWGDAFIAKLSLATPGDFDADGDVDGSDFIAWQSHFPLATGATLADGDADGDGDVDGADFVVWQTNFPYTPGAGAAPVAEPSALLLAGCGITAFALFGRRRSNRATEGSPNQFRGRS
jgi:hypothetical protein